MRGGCTGTETGRRWTRSESSWESSSNTWSRRGRRGRGSPTPTPSEPSHPNQERAGGNSGLKPWALPPTLAQYVPEVQAGEILEALGYDVLTPEEVWAQPLGITREAYRIELADKMRYLLGRSSENDVNVLGRRLVVVLGPRVGRERRVYPVCRFTPSMCRTLLLLVHGPRLAIGGSLERTSRVFCPKEYGEAHLPTFPFMMVDMRQVLSFHSTPRRARRPPDRYADSLGMDAPVGNRGKSRGPRKTPGRAK